MNKQVRLTEDLKGNLDILFYNNTKIVVEDYKQIVYAIITNEEYEAFAESDRKEVEDMVAEKLGILHLNGIS